MTSWKEMGKAEKQKLVLAILGGLIGLVLCYLLLIQPKIMRLNELGPKARKLKQELATWKKEIQEMESLERQVTQLRRKEQTYRKFIPQESDPSQLLNYLSNEAKDTEVTLLEVEPQKKNSVGNGYFREILLTVRAKGGYHDLGRFLSRLETGDRYIAVESFEISSDPKDLQEHLMKLNLKTYATP